MTMTEEKNELRTVEQAAVDDLVEAGLLDERRIQSVIATA
jgi:hypothetical protein